MKTFEPIQKLNELSVFFPCYNEEANIEELINKALSVVPCVAEKYEIIIVNDGSKDRTGEIAHKLASINQNIRVVDHLKNQGYGGAVNTGLRSAKYSWVFFTDSDLQFDLEDLYKFVAQASKNEDDLIIGYRIRRAEGFKRFIFAKGMKFWNMLFLGFPFFIKDIDCAFKLIRKSVIDDVGELSSKGNLVSTELLLKAYKLGYSFHQIGVPHYNRRAGISTCGGLKDILKVVRETFVVMKILKSQPRFVIPRFIYNRVVAKTPALLSR